MDISHVTIPNEEEIEVQAFVSLFDASSPAFAGAFDFACLKVGNGCAISLPAAPAFGLNRIIGVRATEDLGTAYEWMKARLGNRVLQIDAEHASQNVRGWIQDKKLRPTGAGWVKLTRPTRTLQLPQRWPFDVRKALPSDADTFASVLCSGFGFPHELSPLWSAIVGKHGWSCFIAEKGEAVIGGAAMFSRNGYAWLGGATTLTEFRGMGVQQALINARLNEGRKIDVHTFAVETTVPQPGEPNISFANLSKAGFRRSYNRTNFSLE